MLDFIYYVNCEGALLQYNMAKEKTFSLKDLLFNEGKIKMLASRIKSTYSDFDDSTFVKNTVDKFPELELKQRIAWIREQLYIHLPNDYPKAVDILIKSLPERLDPSRTDDDFGDFIYAPFADYVANYGVIPVHLDTSLSALREMTMRFSAEDAIRYFINAFPEETFEKFEAWSEDENYHVRRLVSEGTRPKLPWAQKIHIDIEKPIPLLSKLYYDKTRYVTRSVANHMNDISKLNPDPVMDILESWQKSGKQEALEMDFIIKHSLRTLIKAGNERALEMLGFSKNPSIEISNLKIKDLNVKIGEALEFSFLINSKSDESLMIDYIMYFQNKNGQMKNKKVHKLKQVTLKSGEQYKVVKKHPLREMTTRTLYPGTHRVEIQINGGIVESLEFELVV